MIPECVPWQGLALRAARCGAAHQVSGSIVTGSRCKFAGQRVEVGTLNTRQLGDFLRLFVVVWPYKRLALAAGR